MSSWPGYRLVAGGLVAAVCAMALDAWTELRGLELISGCLGLITSVIAAIMVILDPGAVRERIDELSGAIPDASGRASAARRPRPVIQAPSRE